MEVALGGMNGGIAIVSAEDYDRVIQYNWWKNDEGYVVGYIDGKSVRLHHYIMNAACGESVDHINGRKEDNRRENLRFGTPGLQSQNKHVVKTACTSKYRGVFRNSRGRYQASIMIDYVRHNLGVYDTEIEAAMKWDIFIVSHGLDHIELNLPNKRDEYIKMEYEPYEPPENTNEYIGVAKDKNKYAVRVFTKDGNKHIGSFKDPIEAARKHDEFIVKNRLLGRRLNFPEDHPDFANDKEILTECEWVDEFTVKLLLDIDPSKAVMIDKDDYDKIKHYYCYVCSATGYVMLRIGNKQIRIHRFLLNVTNPKIYIDHIDRNPLNNTRSNLRRSDCHKNPQNKSKIDGTTSIYIGVHREKESKRWIANISYNHKTVLYASYNSEEIAARARDLYILENLKDQQYALNFVWSAENMALWKKQIDEINSNKSRAKVDRNKPNKTVKKTKDETSSKYVGVQYNKKTSRWDAVIYEKGKVIYKKAFKTEELAVRARDLYIVTNLKDRCYKLNFDWSEKDIAEWKRKVGSAEHKSTSSYTGVYFDAQTDKWMTTLSHKNKDIFRKRYDSEAYAARARDLKILESLPNETNKLNFKWTPEDIKKWKKILNFK